MVGNKTDAELHQDWLGHFEATHQKGRPEGHGWFTVTEMADAAGCHRHVIDRYLQNNYSLYETVKGSNLIDGVNRNATFYRFKS